MDKLQQLRARFDGLADEDWVVLERLERVVRIHRGKCNNGAQVADRLIREEDTLRLKHLRLADEIKSLSYQLDRLVHEKREARQFSANPAKEPHGQVVSQVIHCPISPTQRQPLPVSSTHERQQLAEIIDDLVAEDVAILEKIADFTRRSREVRTVEIERQLMKGEKLLRIRHQELDNEINRLKDELDWLDLKVKNPQLAGRPDHVRPGQLAHSVGYGQHPASRGDQHLHGSKGNQNSARRTAGQLLASERSPKQVKLTTPISSNQSSRDSSHHISSYSQHPADTSRRSVVANQQPDMYRKPRLSPTYEQKFQRQDREQKEKLTELEAEEHRKQQFNMSHRPTIMFSEARDFGYSLEDVKTAWDVLDRERSHLSPAEWLERHLDSQMQMIKNDAIKKYCRRFRIIVPENSERYLSTPRVHEAWQQNDGYRDKAADDCVRRMVDKVDEFLGSTAGVTDRAEVAKLLLDNSFDVELSRWKLQCKAAEATAWQVACWLAPMWETTYNTEESIEEIFKSDLNANDKREKVKRMLMAERGMLWAAVDSVFILHEEHTWSDSIEAVEACNGNLHRAKDYFKECEICHQTLIMSKLIGIPYCGCHICAECFIGHFSQLAQTTPCMLRYSCPGCDGPDLPGMDGDASQDYFGLLGSMLRRYLDPGDCNLFHTKLVNWGLMKEENFRWCANDCCNGFVLDGLRIKKVQCPHCRKYQCFDCNKPWEDQHQGVSCEEFEAWKIKNDPELQAKGLAAHLVLNGINCPNCKMRYELAKGGCMHFKCPQCHHEFCCDCNLPFQKYPACNKFPSCEDKGLHAHHPRDCLYYLRDQPVRNLQKLLQDNGVDYIGPGAAQNNAGTCQVDVQLETTTGLQDNVCGKALKGQSGLCELHYKEYLVTLINKKRLDPVSIFDAGDLIATLGRSNIQAPAKQRNEGDDAYRKRLMEVVRTQVPLTQV